MSDDAGDVIVSPRAPTAEETAAKGAKLRKEIAEKLERITTSIGHIQVGNDHRDYQVVQELDKVNQLLSAVASAVELGIVNCSACGGTKWHAEEGDCPYDGDRQWFYRQTWPQLVYLPTSHPDDVLRLRIQAEPGPEVVWMYPRPDGQPGWVLKSRRYSFESSVEDAREAATEFSEHCRVTFADYYPGHEIFLTGKLVGQAFVPVACNPDSTLVSTDG